MITTLTLHRVPPEVPRLLTKPNLSRWEQKLRGVFPPPLPAALAWTTIAAPPRARWRSAAFNVADKLWIVGGYNEDGTCADIHIYDPVTAAWSTVANPFTFWEQAVAISGGKLYAISGCQACWTLTAAVQRFDPVSGSLVDMAPLPIPCILPVTVVTPDGKIYVMGGCTPPPLTDTGGPPSSYLDAVQVLDPTTGIWSAAAPMPVTRDSFAAVAAPDGRIYTFGGFNTATTFSRTDVFDPATNSWQRLADMPKARSCHAAAMTANGCVHVIGGLEATGITNVDTFDPTVNAWKPNTPLLSGRWFLAAATVMNHVYAAGGFFRLGPYQDDNANVFAVPSVEVTV